VRATEIVRTVTLLVLVGALGLLAGTTRCCGRFQAFYADVPERRPDG